MLISTMELATQPFFLLVLGFFLISQSYIIISGKMINILSGKHST